MCNALQDVMVLIQGLGPIQQQQAYLRELIHSRRVGSQTCSFLYKSNSIHLKRDETRPCSCGTFTIYTLFPDHTRRKSPDSATISRPITSLKMENTCNPLQYQLLDPQACDLMRQLLSFLFASAHANPDTELANWPAFDLYIPPAWVYELGPLLINDVARADHLIWVTSCVKAGEGRRGARTCWKTCHTHVVSAPSLQNVTLEARNQS